MGRSRQLRHRACLELPLGSLQDFVSGTRRLATVTRQKRERDLPVLCCKIEREVDYRGTQFF